MKAIQRFGGLLVLLIFCILIIILEEVNFGNGIVYFANRYQNVVYRNITVARKNFETEIGIVIIMERKEDEDKYLMALDTLRCYAKHFKYNLDIIHILEEPDLAKRCTHKDFMFRRHCALSLRMTKMHSKWILFLDADMAVINPNHLIENFVPKSDLKTQIIFYNRIMNQEVMAGSYLVKNSEFSRKFLMFWADYEKKLPKSFHGSDNGAIHSAIVEFSLPSLDEKRKNCEKKYWSTAKDYMGLSFYEVCMQHFLMENKIPEIRILPKGRFAWARDGWLSNSVWSETDFVVHGWQKRRQDAMLFGRWHSPLVYEKPFNLTICGTSEAYLNWKYKNTFIGNVIDVDRRILSYIDLQKTEFDRISKLL